MKVVIFGATGMVGKGVLLECLDDARVERVLVVSRHPIDVSHPKLREIVHRDFFDFYPLVRRQLPRYVTTTANIGRAMIEVAAGGYPRPILFSADINRLAAAAERAPHG
jgi:nucleoside-diphosphate-sugar epimerase